MRAALNASEAITRSNAREAPPVLWPAVRLKGDVSRVVPYDEDTTVSRSAPVPSRDGSRSRAPDSVDYRPAREPARPQDHGEPQVPSGLRLLQRGSAGCDARRICGRLRHLASLDSRAGTGRSPALGHLVRDDDSVLLARAPPAGSQTRRDRSSRRSRDRVVGHDVARVDVLHQRTPPALHHSRMARRGGRRQSDCDSRRGADSRRPSLLPGLLAGPLRFRGLDGVLRPAVRSPAFDVGLLRGHGGCSAHRSAPAQGHDPLCNGRGGRGLLRDMGHVARMLDVLHRRGASSRRGGRTRFRGRRFRTRITCARTGPLRQRRTTSARHPRSPAASDRSCR